MLFTCIFRSQQNAVTLSLSQPRLIDFWSKFSLCHRHLLNFDCAKSMVQRLNVESLISAIYYIFYVMCRAFFFFSRFLSVSLCLPVCVPHSFNKYAFRLFCARTVRDSFMTDIIRQIKLTLNCLGGEMIGSAVQHLLHDYSHHLVHISFTFAFAFVSAMTFGRPSPSRKNMLHRKEKFK